VLSLLHLGHLIYVPMILMLVAAGKLASFVLGLWAINIQEDFTIVQTHSMLGYMMKKIWDIQCMILANFDLLGLEQVGQGIYG